MSSTTGDMGGHRSLSLAGRLGSANDRLERIGKKADPLADIPDKPEFGWLRRVTWLALIGAGAAFSVWGTTVPLESAVVSQGRLVAEGNTKPIESITGGRIKSILVDEGDFVERGQVLVEFDRAQAQASFDSADSLYLSTLARGARLRAEAAGHDSIRWPDELLQRSDDHHVQDLMLIESRLFDTRRAELDGKIEIAERRLTELEAQLQALQEEVVSIDRQRTLITEEENDVGSLVEKGLARKPQLLALQRANAQLIGTKSRLLGEVRKTNEQLSSAELEIDRLQNQWTADAIKQLTDNEATQSDVLQRRKSAADLLENNELRAPEAGRITQLEFFGRGGVVSPSEPIMSLVPQNDAFVIVSRVRPSDIDSIYEGQEAEIRLTAYHFREQRPMAATTTNVSADLVLDERTGDYYYEVRLKIDPEARAKQPNVQLYPGMPADVVIKTGERTMFEYIADPLVKAAYISFREE